MRNALVSIICLFRHFEISSQTKKSRAHHKLFPAFPSPHAKNIIAGTQKERETPLAPCLSLFSAVNVYCFLFVINMRTNRFFFLKKEQSQINTEVETAVQQTQEMGSDVSTTNYQKSSSENDANSEIDKFKRPRTEKIKTAKPEAVVLKRRRSYSECDSLSSERKNLCKKLRVNQLYTDYCGRNSFMAAFFRLLGECLQSTSKSLNLFNKAFPYYL